MILNTFDQDYLIALLPGKQVQHLTFPDLWEFLIQNTKRIGICSAIAPHLYKLKHYSVSDSSDKQGDQGEYFQFRKFTII